VPIVPSYHYLVGPLVAFGALVVIILICRWVFSTSDRDARAARRTAAAVRSRGGDYGLLVPVASVRTPDDAQMLRAVLRDAGIRSTLSGSEVLVFPADAPRARDLVSS
jgi:spore maturation protein SpmB